MMTKVLAKATLIASAALALGQPVLAQSVQTRPYSEVEAEQRAYEQGRADEAEDAPTLVAAGAGAR